MKNNKITNKLILKQVMDKYNFDMFRLELVIGKYNPKKEQSTQLSNTEKASIIEILRENFGGLDSSVDGILHMGLNNILILAKLNKDFKQYKSNEVVGFAFAEINSVVDMTEPFNMLKEHFNKEVYLERIAVLKNVRKTKKNNNDYILGIGSAMLNCLQEVSRASGQDHLSLASVRNTNTENFYKSNGLLKKVEYTGDGYIFRSILKSDEQSYATMIANIVDFMMKNNLTTHKQFVIKYKELNLTSKDLLKGCKEPNEYQAKILLNSSKNIIQTPTVLYTKELIDELMSIRNPNIQKYLDFMFLYSPNSVYISSQKHKHLEDKYNKSLGGFDYENNEYLRDDTILKRLDTNALQKMIRIFNDVNIILIDKNTTKLSKSKARSGMRIMRQVLEDRIDTNSHNSTVIDNDSELMVAEKE